MQTLVYFGIWAAFIFFMMRFGCGAHVMGHRHHDHGEPAQGGGGQKAGLPPASAVDPVCGMTVATARAKPSVHAGQVYYFCSAEHRDAFEASPERYMRTQAEPKSKPMEHSHV